MQGAPTPYQTRRAVIKGGSWAAKPDGVIHRYVFTCGRQPYRPHARYACRVLSDKKYIAGRDIHRRASLPGVCTPLTCDYFT
jgi:hypothetical protein